MGFEKSQSILIPVSNRRGSDSPVALGNHILPWLFAFCFVIFFQGFKIRIDWCRTDGENSATCATPMSHMICFFVFGVKSSCGKLWPLRPLLNRFTLTLNKPLFNRRTFSSFVSKLTNRFQGTYPDWKEASGSQAAPFNFHSPSSPPFAPACCLAPLHL